MDKGVRELAKGHSRLTEVVIVCALLIVIVLLRGFYLEADPPPGITTSSSILTDPPLYTWFAKAYTLVGNFNPYDDQRIVVFIRTAMTALGVIIFKLFGVGIRQSNLIGLLFSIGSLFLFFLFVRRLGGALAGLFYLAMIAVNYNQLFLGRLPFLEHAMMFFSFLSLVIITYYRSISAYLLAGLSLGIGVFFGKVIGIIFLLPFGAYLLYRWWWIKEPRYAGRVISFSVGLGIITTIWILINFLTARTQVSGYFGDIFALYGTPEGLQSISWFIWKFVSFGDSSNLIGRMTLAAILTVVYLGRLLFQVVQRKQKELAQQVDYAGHLFIVMTIVGFWLALMIWDYRPLRYQLVLIYIFYGAASLVLADWWRGLSESNRKKPPYLFYLVFFPIVLPLVYKLYALAMKYLSPETTFDEDKYLIIFLAIIITVLTGIANRFQRKMSFSVSRKVMRGIVILCISLVILRGFAAYGYWLVRPTFTARDNSRDMGLILSPQAILSGPYAAQLTLENNLGAVVHMFGTKSVDPDFFHTYPITHLLLDEANENRARADYPDLMDSAKHVVTYHIGPEKVRMFRVAGNTGNPAADSYMPSQLEQAIDLYRNNQINEGNVLAVQFLDQHPENLSGYLTVATVAAQHQQLPLAEQSFKKAIEFSPTNYHLISTLATFYRERYIATGDNKFKQEGLKYFERAINMVPIIPNLNRAYHELKEKEAWQLKNDTTSLFPQ